jgi:tetratricopeptide (TPR) repeat protein
MAQETIVLPTYEVGPADPNPMFYTNESYQGAQRRVYPYPLQDHLTHARKDKTYTALTLENEYVRISVLPELGGRLFSATDKTNGYEFFYRQHVIKPALIGMLGAWISGGVEWCAFHHHRNTTFMPVDYALVENPDGSKTIWVGETERRHRMRWLVGLTLRPGSSCLEAQVKFFNRTAQPHSILYWANAAVHVNDQYQVIFPPSVQAATYHSKIDFTYWPISRGKYRGHDYTGVDLSWWKNSPESNSFFAWDLREDFMGGYDHGKQAGVVHVADHHLVCGAKLWEWGTGPYGRAWDKILTDDDGPYAELMTGAWSDNQPDYSWIKPYEVKTITQCWYPVRGIGGFKNANLHGAVNLELRPEGTILVGFHATSRHRGARALLKAGQKVLLDQTVDIGPDRPFRRDLRAPSQVRETDLRASLVTAQGDELVAYQPVRRNPPAELPKPVTPPPKPAEIKTLEELYLTGLRVEQIHNPSVDPLDYYREAVRRDPGDSRANTMLAISANKRGQHHEAERHARRAIERLSAEYTRPQNTEAYYQLGLALRAQGKLDEAYDSFYRASWDQAFHSAAYYQLAELSCRKGDFARSLDQIERSLATNGWNTKALNLKAAVCRKLGRAEEARAAARSVLAADPLDLWAANELMLAGGDFPPHLTAASLEQRVPADVQSCLELATDYMGPGMWDEAVAVLERPVREKAPFAGTYPMVHYLLGYLYEQKGQRDKAAEAFAAAARMPGDYCFPFRAEGPRGARPFAPNRPTPTPSATWATCCSTSSPRPPSPRGKRPGRTIRAWRWFTAISAGRTIG